MLYLPDTKCWNVSFKDQYCFQGIKAKSIAGIDFHFGYKSLGSSVFELPQTQTSLENWL